VQVPIAAAIVIAADPRLRRRWKAAAAAFAAIALVGAAYLLHARHIYLAFGNTFGLMSGGDRKSPLPEHLRHPGLFADALRVWVAWGCGAAGAIALGIVAGARRRWPPLLVGLGVGAALWAVASLRYSSFALFGSHYTVFGALLAGWAAAHAVSALPSWRAGPRRAGWALLAVAVLAQGAWAFAHRRADAQHDPAADPIYAAGVALRALLGPGAGAARARPRVVVRSMAGAYEPFWKTANNFEDPTVFYLADARGWVLPADADDPAPLAQWRDRGARFFVDPVRLPPSSPITGWLAGHAHVVAATAAGAIWQLDAPPSL
jgi:hypothetical protein